MYFFNKLFNKFSLGKQLKQKSQSIIPYQYEKHKSTTPHHKMIPQQKQNSFHVKQISKNTKSVHLNNIYEIKQDQEFYEIIEFLVEQIIQKNNNNKYHIKQRFGLNYFSSIQFILGKCKMEQQKCMICLMEFQINKDLEKELGHETDQDIYMLPCSHKFHISCLMNLIGEKKWAKCPICSTIFGKMTGDQPEGDMKVSVNKHLKLPGYQKYGTITINYYMKAGVRNGVSYAGTSRTAHLPDNKQGNQVLQLLKQAFNRKLIFTVGRSVTTGLDNQTVWNGIHHKTSTSGGVASFGYPDPTYLDRVKQQLAAKGITLNSIKNKH